jgi:hypothetical protein
MLKESALSKFLFFTVLMLLIMISGFRPVGLDLDSQNYAGELLLPLRNINFISKEPTYWLFQQINLFFFSGQAASFFIVFAFISILLKAHAIKAYSYYPWLSLLCYICFFYIIQDMTQIRAGVAIGFVFWSTKDIIDKSKNSFIAKIILATLFHYSAIVFMALYFIKPSFYKSKWFYCVLPLFGVFLAKLNISLIFIQTVANYLPSFLSSKIWIYIELLQSGQLNIVDPINIGNLFLLCIYYFALWLCVRRERVASMHHYNTDEAFKIKISAYSIKCLGFGFFFLFSFSFIEVFAYRIANYLFFYLIIIIPFIIKNIKPKLLIGSAFVVFLAYICIKNISLMLDFKVFT